jgi:hypothetical protein
MKANVLCLGLALSVSAGICSEAQSSVTLPYSFPGGTDGAQPNSLIQAQDGAYYGTTAYGGSSQGNGNCVVGTTDVGCGTIFRLTPGPSASGLYTLTTLYQFSGGTDGGEPTGIIQGPDGNLYGTTAFGGSSQGNDNCQDSSGTDTGCGTIFEISRSNPPAAGTLIPIYNFVGGSDGAYPNPLTMGGGGVFYGSALPCSTCSSFPSTYGILFNFIPNGSNLVSPQILSTFGSSTSTGQNGSNFAYPNALLETEVVIGQTTQDLLYGAAQVGGPSGDCFPAGSAQFGCGGVFAYNLSTKTESDICYFGTGPVVVSSSSSAVKAATPDKPNSGYSPYTIVRQSTGRFPTNGSWSYNSNPTSIALGADGNIYGTTVPACNTNPDSPDNTNPTPNYIVSDSCWSEEATTTLFEPDGTQEQALTASPDIVYQCIPPATSTGTGTMNTVYTFTGTTDTTEPSGLTTNTDGGGSLQGLLLAADGNFYGTSGNIIFDVTPAQMKTFTASSSTAPLANLTQYALTASGYSPNSMIQGSDGKFYGTTVIGGNDSDGGIFEVSTSLNPPVQLCWQTPCSGSQINSSTEITLGNAATLSWTVPNANSLTSQQCYAFVEGSNAATAGIWPHAPNSSVSGGVVSGSASITPTAPGAYEYALTCGGTVSGIATLNVTVPQLTFSGGSLTAGTVGQAYSASVASYAGGGQTPYAFSMASGSSLPPGFSPLYPNGTISGTPTAAGSYTFSITVEDAETPAASVTTTFTIVVMNRTPQVALMVQPNTGVGYGQVVTLTATESPVEGIAQGYSWTVAEDSSVLVTGALSNGSGSYTMNTSPTAGQHTFSATFSSTQNYYPPGSSNIVTLTVAKATPTVTAWPTASAITVGQTLASSTLSGGTASTGGTFAWTTPTTVPGVGSYSGNVTLTPTDSTDYNNVTGTVTVTVNAAPGFTLSPSPMSVSVAQGSSGMSTITVADVGGFSGSVALSAAGLPNGVSSSFAAGSAVGTQVLTLTASTSAQITSAPVTVTVTGTSGTLSATTSLSLSITPQPSFTAGSGGTTSMSIIPGATTGNTGTISIAGTNGFAGQVNLTCNVSTLMTNVNDMPSCNLNPASVTISGTAAQTSILTVTTTAASSAKNNIKKLIWPTSGTTLALVVLFTIPRRRRGWLTMSGIVLLYIAIGAVGCGGGGGQVRNTGTTAGSYTITVTGTSGSVSATVGTVNVTVQ